MRDAVVEDRPHARIGEDFPTRSRRGIARLDRIQIGDQTAGHRRTPLHPARYLGPFGKDCERGPPYGRPRPAYRSDQSVAWTVATAFITAPIRAPAWITSAETPCCLSTFSWLSMHMPQPFIADTASEKSSNSSFAMPCDPMKFIRRRAGFDPYSSFVTRWTKR